MKFTNKPNDFREKNVLRKRIIPDIVGFKDMENILENNEELKNTINDIDDDNDSRLK
ncbi:hypothetical protein [Proteiniborus sp.]|uniref:hypothetical protein n=1 Tax=Proteiniborus sp. TaxID=2079015 RepID=UPI00332EA1B3